MKVGLGVLVICLVELFSSAASAKPTKFTGHGVRILSGRGTPAEPYNKPTYATRGVGYAVEQRRKHEAQFKHLYENAEGSNTGKFVKLHARRLTVDRNETDSNVTALGGFGVNITYNWDDPNRPNKGCQGQQEWDMSCNNCVDESACNSGNCKWLVPPQGAGEPRCEYDRCYSGSCDVSSTCDMDNPSDCWWQIPCRDCTGPGQACEGVAACTDPLRTCEQITDDEKENMSVVHPCLNPVCESSRTSPGCLDLVYDFCCDPEFDDCNPSAEVIEIRKSTPW